MLIYFIFHISISILLDGSISEVLNKLTVRVISEDECKNSFGNIIHKTTMCAVGVEKGSGTCQVPIIFFPIYLKNGPPKNIFTKMN